MQGYDRRELRSGDQMIGRCFGRTIELSTEIPDTIVQAMVGRKVRELFDREDLGRDIRVLSIREERLFWLANKTGWILELSGQPLLPMAVVRKQQKARRRPA